MRYKKRADGRYARQIRIGESADGPVKKTIYAKTEKELDKKYRDLMYMLDRGAVVDSKEVTFLMIREEWYSVRLDGKIRRNTECGYASLFKRFKTLDSMKVKDIRRYHIERLISDIEKEGYTNTAQTVLSMLRKIFNYAIESDLIYKNPCGGLSVKHKAEAKRVLSEKEKETIDNTEFPIKEKTLLYLLRYTGIRRGELFALHSSDIDHKEMTIHINKTVIDNNGHPYIQDMTKTPAGDRYIPIFLKLVKPLFEYAEGIDGYLFLNRNGKVMANNSMKHMFDRMKKEYGFGEDLTMHCFRYNFVSECYSAGVDIKKTQAWVGHDDVGTTLNIYTKLSKQEISDGGLMDKYYESQEKVKKQNKPHIHRESQAN